MELQLLKTHLRIDHDFEDDLLLDYLSWAEAEIKDSVTTELLRDESFFADNPIYKRALVLLVGHYFENRVGYAEKSLAEVPDGILSAVQKLRGSYVSLAEVIESVQR